MQTVTFDRACEIIEEACYLQPTIDGGDKTIHFGVDDRGREFVLIVSIHQNESRLGML